MSAALTTLYLDTNRLADAHREAERGIAAIHAFHQGTPHLDVTHLRRTSPGASAAAASGG